MIGIVARLASAAKLARAAEAAIDVAANKLAPGDLPPGSAGNASTVPGSPPADELPACYRALLDAGVPDARRLLPASEASRVIGKRIRRVSLSGDGETLACDYQCADAAGTTLGVHLSASRTWQYFDSEIAKKEIFHDLGDAAFRGGRQIYVKCGEHVFWIHTAGEVMVGMALEAARLVVARLGDSPQP